MSWRASAAVLSLICAGSLAQDEPMLEPGPAREGVLRGTTPARIRLALGRGEIARLEVDVPATFVRVLDSEGRPLARRLRYAAAAGGSSILYAAAEADLVATVELSRLTVGGGQPFVGGELLPYRLRLAARAPATAEDEQRIRAQEALFEAQEHYRRAEDGGSRADSLRRAQSEAARAVALYKGLGEDALEAEAQWTLCRARGDEGSHTAQAPCVEEALALARRAGDRWAERLLLVDLGGRTGDVTQEIRLLEESQALSRELGAASDFLIANNLGVVYRIVGDYQQALAKARESEMLATNDLGRGFAFGSLGQTYDLLGRPERAVEYLERSRDAWEGQGYYQRAIVRMRLGRVRAGLGAGEAGLAEQRQALELCRAAQDALCEGQALVFAGWTQLSLGRAADAEQSFERALPLFAQRPDGLREAEAFRGLGEARRRRGSGDAASAYRESLKRQRAVFHFAGEWASLLGLGQLERAAGALAAARAHAQEALALVESARGRLPIPEQRAGFLADKRALYELAIDVEMALHAREPGGGRLAAAFELSERARARALLDTLAGLLPALSGAADPALARRDREIAGRTSGLVSRLQRAAPSGADRVELERKIDALLAEAESARALLFSDGTSLEARLTAEPVAPRRIQQELLDADTTLVEYILGDSESHAFVLTRASFDAVRLGPRAPLEAAARRAYGAVSVRGAPAAQAELALAALAKLALVPLADRLLTPRIAVVADGAFHYVPFAALPKSGAAGAPPLLADHEVVLLPSAASLSLLREVQGSRGRASRTLALFSDPVFGKDDARLAAVAKTAPERAGLEDDAPRADELGVGSLRRLPFAQDEAAGIARLVRGPVTLRSGFEASRERAIDPELADHRVVHFATHALLNERHPELSGLALSLFHPDGRPRDGFLRLQDIYRLRLQADLVVLSACHTAFGPDLRGEGLVSLARGFMHAGAPRLVASLWSVPDRATAELMQRFYRGLSGEVRPARALREAQLALRQDPRWRSPFYWAAFAFQGDWR